MAARLTVTCSACGWSVAGPIVSSGMESEIRRHAETEHRALFVPGFGGRPRLSDVLRHFRVDTAVTSPIGATDGPRR